MGGAWHRAFVHGGDAVLVGLVKMHGILLGLVGLDLSIGSSLVGDGE